MDQQAVNMLQSLVNQIIQDNTSPYIHYLRAHEMKMLNPQLAIIDKALDQGLVTLEPGQLRCKLSTVDKP